MNDDRRRAAWQIVATTARLTGELLEAELERGRIERGLCRVRFRGHPALDADWLFVEPSATTSREPTEWYRRTDDLVVVYRAAPPERSDDLQLAWRYVAPSTVEFQASADTLSAEAAAQLRVGSHFSGALLGRAAAGGEFTPFDPPSAGEKLRFEEPLLFVVRPTGADRSFVQAVHPGDFRGDELSVDVGTGRAPSLRLVHTLFARQLEKGVLLRSRVCGAVVPRGDDLAAAAALYDDFARSPTPLSA